MARDLLTLIMPRVFLTGNLINLSGPIKADIFPFLGTILVLRSVMGFCRSSQVMLS